MLDGKSKKFLTITTMSLVVIVFLYISLWVLLFKILGSKTSGYSAYKNGEFGEMAITDDVFSNHGYVKISSYAVSIFSLINSLFDSTTFETSKNVDDQFIEATENRQFIKRLNNNSFIRLIKTKTIAENGQYYFVVRHSKMYIYNYTILGYRLCYTQWAWGAFK